MRRYRWNWKKCFSNVSLLLEVMLILWAIISTIQIVIFNTSDDPYSHYSSWNLWTIFTDRG